MRRSGMLLAALLSTTALHAQNAPVRTEPVDLRMVSGGPAVERPAPPSLDAGHWTALAWVRVADQPVQTTLLTIAGVSLHLHERAPELSWDPTSARSPTDVTINDLKAQSGQKLSSGWHLLALVRDGRNLRLEVDGKSSLSNNTVPLAPVSSLRLGGHKPDDRGFTGLIAGAQLVNGALTPAQQRALLGPAPDPATRQFTPNSAHWQPQVRQMFGQLAPQPPATLPHGAPPDKPVARPVPNLPALAERAPGLWTVNGWSLASAPDVTVGGAALSQPGYRAARWYAATVPGTVLTTLIDRGVYPDPAHGLNNLAIPYDLASHDWWYRTEFDLPAVAAPHRALVLNGANYAAEVWVNGARVGDLTGAFIRGRFDVSPLLRPGRNAVAIRVSPPPHPGLAQEESLTSGVGENGGMMALDGPTFAAAEGWDWIPTVRDRETGLWQSVDLVATGDARLGDPRVVTTLPRPDNSVADVGIEVPVRNLSAAPISADVSAGFDDVQVARTVSLAPGEERLVSFTPAAFPQLAVQHPRLWWPNGYGDPALHTLRLAATIAGAPSDTKTTRFGMREVTYDLPLMDAAGALHRDAVRPALAPGTHLLDVTHTGIRQVEGGWVYSIAPGAEASPALAPVPLDSGPFPFLVLKVNGVRIAARGGSVGMDDFLKRTDRARLEPFFQLHRDAHLNIIRNWVGQDTEQTFFDLADEYGLMILNDFWESTQDYNAEAQDPALFLANAGDVARRYQTHPSIILWFGRNEGVPQPIINESLDRLIRAEDGTRLYMPSSNRIDLHDSGPYNWRPPAEYFTTDSNGFAVEVGTPSFPTLEAWERTVPASERWPVSDTWAYHDWHQTGNGAVKSFTDAMATEFGASTSLPDFERKAQMLEYESYRAIFEGMNAGLWSKNSGRMLWMTQPAWPSSAWQIFSSDGDTHAAFYGVKKASEPLHVQMNLPDHDVMVINNGRDPLGPTTVHARVVSLAGKVLLEKSATVSGAAGAAIPAFPLDIDAFLANGPVLVRLEALDASGTRRSDNFYWQAADPAKQAQDALMTQATMPSAEALDAAAHGSASAQLRMLNTLAPVALAAGARGQRAGGETLVTVDLRNTSATPALMTKLTLFAGDRQVLPALYTDNYVSLLPGEARQVTIRVAAQSGPLRVALRGWNIAPASLPVAN